MSLPSKINAIPNHGFDAISHEIKFLARIVFRSGSFRKIATLSSTVNFLLNYFKKFDDYYPHLNTRASVELTKKLSLR
jgi:DNA mismatch repair protein MutS2